MKVAIHQPNFLPWIGYFHKISLVDTFVFLDDVQFERGKTYTQRTKILVDQNEAWITIPIVNKSGLVLIKEAEVDPSFFWKRKILKTIELNYRKTKGFDNIFPIIQDVFSVKSKYLVDYNEPLIRLISEYLGLNTKFINSSQLNIPNHIGGKEKILEINKCLNSSTYISGKGEGSMRYIDPEDFVKNNIILEWQEFKPLEYTQVKSDVYVKGLSIIDLIFNCSKDSYKWLVCK